jgi:asparagine synthase (glutamine-hydrolysing)
MCGIVAAFGNANDDQVKMMMNRIRHRGPDGSGVLHIKNSILGHVRLSIIDLEGGAQPMTNESGNLAVVLNGEIYNQYDLRQKLAERHIFKNRSDTEVLLHLYEDDHVEMLNEIDGMFAMALAGENGLLLARDPLGIKPLYYGRTGSTFLAASELKAFPQMDELHMLPAGHAMYANGEPWQFKHPFQQLPFLISPPLEEVLSEVRRRLDEAVKKRLMSDVPVGVYLSGGIDSSIIAALMRPYTVQLHSFTAGMPGAPDLEAARNVAHYLDTTHHELIYTADEVKKSLPEVIKYLESFDAPLVRSAVPMYFVSRLASEHVKVVLSGEGADELFVGYSYLNSFYDREHLRKELSDITIRLQDTNLQRADRMSMAHGLETRVPFLDLDLVRYVGRLPIELLEQRSDRPEKWLLREACRGLIPPEILERRKMKFSEGAGSSEVIMESMEKIISFEEYERQRMIAPGLILRSPEELYYYKIWREVMGPELSPSLVGRTLDMSAGTNNRSSIST